MTLSQFFKKNLIISSFAIFLSVSVADHGDHDPFQRFYDKYFTLARGFHNAKKYKEALPNWKILSEYNCEVQCGMVARYYREGLGVEKNLEEAKVWEKKKKTTTTEVGDYEHIARFYKDGKYLKPPDLKRSYMWYKLSVKNKNNDNQLKELEKNLSKTELKKALEMTEICKKSKFDPNKC